MKILKFGGSSVAAPDRIKAVAAIVRDNYSRGEKFSFVVSAFGGVTDKLLEMAQTASAGDDTFEEEWQALKQRHIDMVEALLKGDYRKEAEEKVERRFANLLHVLKGIHALREVTPRSKDYIVSFGERNSAYIISKYLSQEGMPANYLDARKVVLTDDSFGNAQVQVEETYQRIRDWFSVQPGLAVITGFVGATSEGITTTLGRGGSDYSAALFGAALGADVIEIWTDVNGILTADPRAVRDAHTLSEVTYAEAMEMSHFGAKVIYPPTIQPALRASIPIYIRNTFNAEFEGTKISGSRQPTGNLITGMASIGNVVLLTLRGSGMVGVPGFAARLFNSLARGGINIIMITQGSSEHSISFAVTPSEADVARELVEAEFDLELTRKMVEPVKVESNLSIVAIIGESIKVKHGISGTLFKALGVNGINVVAIAQGSSELIISVVIHKSDEKKALNAIHETFFKESITQVHLFMVGVGLVGKKLLEQIQQQNDTLRKEHQIEVCLAGVANSQKMIFSDQGIDLAGYQDALTAGEPSDMPRFVQKMVDMNLRNSVFVDATASDAIPAFYESILEKSISISTPNKVAASSSHLQYRRLKKMSKIYRARYAFETNVGAGLPIITTIQDLVRSGDTITKIEGVLSGTLSYIFGAFTKGAKFSDVVKEAKEKGFTEPDPRVDLSGKDVARKIVILAREIGLQVELDDVLIDPVLPKNCNEAPNIPSFFKELEASDDYFDDLRQKAQDDGKVLRMVAKLENNKCSIGLQAVDASSPFFGLKGGDNMIAITSKRYTPYPLVVRGPGAGADVTAAGVFAEIVKIGKDGW
ncbi:MAG TPA: bifunctional aspartate kinase/homoserine dehydrogenase I [Saprospiraceae bacterium]|nr:bifunctional aspartate kinase/homoserine dehydrogenase I [Saprospiraceae bacterium]